MPSAAGARRTVVTLVLALCALAAPSLASAATQTIAGDRVNVHVTDTGDYQAAFTSPQFGSTAGFFFPPSETDGSSSFWLRFAGGPLDGQLFGGNGRGTQVVPVSNQVTGNFTPSSPALITTVSDVVSEGTTYARITQEARYVNTESKFRLTWKVENRTPSTPLSFRAATAADLFVDGDDSGTGFYTGSTPRFLGGTNSTSRVAGGVEEVLSSLLPGESSPTAIAPWAAYELSRYSDVFSYLSTPNGFTNFIESVQVDNGAGVQWDDHLAPGAALAPGATARYEVVWKLRQPLPLDLSPRQSTPELPAGGGQATKEITATVRDTNGAGVPGRTVRWRLADGSVNGPQDGVATTDAAGEAGFLVRGTTAGLDTVDAYVDVNTNGQRDGAEPGLSAKITWLAQRDVGQPTVEAPALPNGGTLSVGTQASPEDPRVQYFTIPQGQISQFPQAPDGGRVVNLPISVPIAPGAGSVSDVSLLALDPGDDPSTAGGGIAPTGNEGTLYRFVVESVRRSDLYVRYTLTEDGVSQTFTIPIGQIVLIDPQGVVYDEARFDELRATGVDETEARRLSAITGATVRLQRRLTNGQFANVLSGDPGIAPNVNPQITQADGRYQWDVAEGVYRVTVVAPGFVDTVSREVSIPPPVLDLHVGMRRPAAPGAGGGGTIPDPGVKPINAPDGGAPGPGVPGGGDVPGGGPLVPQAPRITAFSVKPATFRPAGKSGAAAKKGGTQLQIRLGSAATLKVVLERTTKGRKVGKACAKPTKKNAKRKACDRYTTVSTVSSPAVAGLNVLRITGRVNGKALAAGAYRVRVQPTGPDGRKGEERSAKLKVLAEKPAKKKRAKK